MEGHTDLYFLASGVTNEDFLLQNFSASNLRAVACSTLDGNCNEINKFRKIYWLMFFGIISGDDPKEWLNELEIYRIQYIELQKQYQEKSINHLDPNLFHPLSASSNSPWQTHKKNEELREEIWKDITRTFPEIELFQQTEIQQTILRLLFTWSKHNHEISYKQGMNEIMGFFFIICYRDRFIGQIEEGFCFHFCSLKSIEADTYTLFSKLMDLGMKPMFESASVTSKPQSSHRNQENSNSLFPNINKSFEKISTPVLDLCYYIFHTLLPRIDSDLYRHLKSQDLEPQFFLLRWIRLLFSREFQFYHTTYIWDALFADYFIRSKDKKLKANMFKPKLEICINLSLLIYLSIAMIKFVKSSLMDSDFGGCVQRLSKYPPVESISILIRIAQELRDEFDQIISINFSSSLVVNQVKSTNKPLIFPGLNVKSTLLHPDTKSINTEQLNYSKVSSYSKKFENNSFNKISIENTSIPNNISYNPINDRNNIENSTSQILFTKSPINELSIHCSYIEDFISTTLNFNQSITIKDELELIKHDLAVLSKILKGELPYSSDFFAITPTNK